MLECRSKIADAIKTYMESIHAVQAAFENNGIRRQGKEYVKPFERMLDEIGY